MTSKQSVAALRWKVRQLQNLLTEAREYILKSYPGAYVPGICRKIERELGIREEDR